MLTRSSSTLYKYLFAYLLFVTAISALINDKAECVLSPDSGTCDVSASMNVPSLCMATVAATLARLYEQLPASQQMFSELFATANFKIVCDDSQNIVASLKLHEATAYFDMNENKIYLPITNDAVNQERLEFQLHHEAIHATTVNRHQSPYCNLNLFSARELEKLAASNRAGTIGIVPIAPVWPPTLSNLEWFEKVIRDDLNLSWHQQLTEFNRKIFYSEKFSVSEKEELNSFRELLEGILLPSGRINLGEPVTKKTLLSSTIRQFSASVIFTHLAWKELPNQKFQLTGIVTDTISALLYRIYLAQMEYQNNVMQNRYVVAVAEFDAHLRTGLTERQLITFFPNLTEQIKRDNDCCLLGNISRCAR